MDKLQEEYKSILESQKAGTSSLNEVLEVQKQIQGLSGELSSLQSAASSASTPTRPVACCFRVATSITPVV